MSAQSSPRHALPMPASIARTLEHLAVAGFDIDVTLVVDEGSSMLIWRHVIDSFIEALRIDDRLGEVRVFGLDSTAASAALPVRAGLRGQDEPRRAVDDEALLAGRRARRVHHVLVFSDCTGDAWYDGRAPRTLLRWGQRALVTVLQPLPTHLWLRTALRRHAWVAFGPHSNATDNRALHIWAAESARPDTSDIAIPVIELAPREFDAWTRWLRGVERNPIDITGVYLPTPSPGSVDDPAFAEPEPDTASQRVARFRRSASPTAVRLAGLLSAAPLSPAFIRAIMERLAPASTLADLAEITLGGLVRRASSDAGSGAPDEVLYQFVDGVREALIRATPRPDVLEVLGVVVSHVHGTEVSAADMITWLRDGGDLARWQGSNAAILTVVEQVFTCLGEHVERLAENLADVPQVRPAGVSAPEIEPTDDIQLLRRWQQGHDDSGDQLLERHFERVERFFLTKVATDLDELVEQTFVGCVRTTPRTSVEDFRSFLFSVAYAVLGEHLRAARGSSGELDLKRMSIYDITGIKRAPVEFRDSRRKFLRALRALPVAQQVAWELHHWEKFELSGIANVLAVTENEAQALLWLSSMFDG